MNSAGYGMIGAVVKGSLLTLALFLLYGTIPFLGAFAGLIVPFPCAYYSLKYGRVTGFSIVFILVFVLSVLSRNSLLPYLLLSVPCSLVLPECLSRGKSSNQALFYTVGLSACVAAGFVAIAVLLFHIDFDGQVASIIHDAMVQVGETYRQAGLSGKELQNMVDGLALVEKSFIRLYPSFVLILFGVVAWLNLVLLKKFSVAVGREICFDDFAQYRNPDTLVWLLILAGFTLLAASTLLSNIALNILFVLYFLYFVQGLAICSWITKKRKVPRILPVVFYVLLAVQPLLTAVVAVFGLVDLWACFRLQNKQ